MSTWRAWQNAKLRVWTPCRNHRVRSAMRRVSGTANANDHDAFRPASGDQGGRAVRGANAMTSPRRWPRQPLLNVWADDLSMDDLLEQMSTVGGVVFTVNPDHLYHLQYNPAFVSAYRSADIITVDSHYVRLALRALGRPV